jgi:hypothetical protein
MQGAGSGRDVLIRPRKATRRLESLQERFPDESGPGPDPAASAISPAKVR